MNFNKNVFLIPSVALVIGLSVALVNSQFTNISTNSNINTNASVTESKIPNFVEGTTNTAVDDKSLNDKLIEEKKLINERAESTNKKVTMNVTGFKNINIISSSYDGDGMYKPPQAYKPYRRYEMTRVDAKGNLLGLINIEVELVSSSEGDAWGYGLDRARIAIMTKYVTLNMGTFNVDYPDTEFVLKNKKITGAKLDVTTEKIKGFVLYSVPKGKSSRTELYGDGIQGPYIIDDSGNIIIEESEKVMVNRIRQKKGIDYSIDYYNGEIYFLRKSIGVEDRIEVEYEYRENLYKRFLFGAGVKFIPTEGKQFGVDFAYESDRLDVYKDIEATE